MVNGQPQPRFQRHSFPGGERQFFGKIGEAIAALVFSLIQSRVGVTHQNFRAVAVLRIQTDPYADPDSYIIRLA